MMERQADMIDLLNTVLGDMEDVYHRSQSGVAAVYEVPRLNFFSCDNNKEQTVARGKNGQPVHGILI